MNPDHTQPGWNLRLLSCELQIEISRLSLPMAEACYKLANGTDGKNPLGTLIYEYLLKAVTMTADQNHQ